MGTIIDTLEYAKELRAAGFNEQQAEAQAKALSRLARDKLVSKEHFDHTIEKLEYRFTQDMEKLQYQLTIRLGGMTAVGVAVLAALMKLH